MGKSMGRPLVLATCRRSSKGGKNEALAARPDVNVKRWTLHRIPPVRTSNRSKASVAVAGLVVCVIGVIWLLVRGPEPFGTLLTVLGAAFAASLLASLWIYRSRS
jgi:hypothetical protein